VRSVSSISDTIARERLEALWDAHYADVLSFLLRRLGDREAAADAAAETFLVAWRRIEVVPADAPRAWLFAVANKVMANSRRGQRRKDALIAKLEQTHLVSSHLPGSEPAVAVVAAFNRLKLRDREVLALVVWEGLPPREAATVLGVSAASFSVRLHRAKQRLRKELVGAGHVESEASATAGVSTPEMEPR
jgi:RNA polymerase sigma factor (sigma-70 family)